jgi:hypothetical protein
VRSRLKTSFVSFWEIGVLTYRVNGFDFLNLKPKESRFLNSNRGFLFKLEGCGLNCLTIAVLILRS